MPIAKPPPTRTPTRTQRTGRLTQKEYRPFTPKPIQRDNTGGGRDGWSPPSPLTDPPLPPAPLLNLPTAGGLLLLSQLWGLLNLNRREQPGNWKYADPSNPYTVGGTKEVSIACTEHIQSRWDRCPPLMPGGNSNNYRVNMGGFSQYCQSFYIEVDEVSISAECDEQDSQAQNWSCTFVRDGVSTKRTFRNVVQASPVGWAGWQSWTPEIQVWLNPWLPETEPPPGPPIIIPRPFPFPLPQPLTEPITEPEVQPLPRPAPPLPIAPPLAPPVAPPGPGPEAPPLTRPTEFPGPRPVPLPLTPPTTTPLPPPTQLPNEDGTYRPQLPPGPTTTPEGTEDFLGERIGQPEAAPPPTLQGIASEVGRIEQKLRVMSKQPSGQAPDLSGLLEQLAEILERLNDEYPGGAYQLVGPCEPALGGGPGGSRSATWGSGTGSFASIIARVDALAELLQHHKDLRQPICRQKASGEEVTVIFEEIG